MMILTQLRLVLNALLKIAFISKHPSENRILDFLIVLFLKEVIVKEVH